MGRYQAYPEYKDSGLQWLGEIPSSWQIIYSKAVFSERNEKAQLDDEQLTASQKYGILPQKLFMEMEQQKVVQVLKGHEILKKVEVDDFVISMRSFQGGIEYSPYSGSISSAYVPLFAKKNISKSFFKYFLKSAPYIQALQSTTNLVRDGQALRYGNFIQVPLPVFDFYEQENIGKFLDHETAKIDTLIEQQQQLIQLLKEKRQAVISHAVTKGLNPNAPMKDSGVEWLGDVPEGWSIVPIKRVCEVKDGTHDTPQYVDPSDETFPLITSKDFDGDNISFSNAKYISKEDHDEIIKRSNTEVGDVLMSMIGGNIGKALIVKNHADFSIKNVALFKASGCEVLAKYILYYLQSGLLDVQISLLSRGGAQGFLSLSDLRNLVFFKVPRQELEEIIGFLNNNVTNFDNLIIKAESTIGIMQERRTALISAAVTGKIDVRNFGAQLT